MSGYISTNIGIHYQFRIYYRGRKVSQLWVSSCSARREGYPYARATLASGLKLALVYRQISQVGLPHQPRQLYMTLPALLTCFVGVTLPWREGNPGARVTLTRGLPYLPCQRSARDNSLTRVNFPVSKKVGGLPSWSVQLGSPGTALIVSGWLRPGGQN